MEEKIISGYRLNDRYTIIKVIKSNRLFIAEDTGKKKVVIKAASISDLDDWSELEKFNKEISLLKSLNNPHIPQFIESFKEKIDDIEYLFLVQAYIKGKSLMEIIRDKNRITRVQLSTCIISILETLTYLHNLLPPLIHKDINPSNIIIDEKDNWFLIDFGTAIRNKGEEVQDADYFEEYAAPEQLDGKADTQSDLYSFGLCLLFLLSGKSPGEHIDENDFSRIDDGMKQFIKKLIEPKKSRRFSGADEALKAYNLITKKDSESRKTKPPLFSKQRIPTFIALAIIITIALFIIIPTSKFIITTISYNQNKELVEAVIHNKTGEVKKLLNAGRNAGATDMDGVPVLHHALEKKSAENAKLLIEFGADINYKGDGTSRLSGPPICLAAEYSITSIIKLLVEKGAKLSVLDVNGYSPLSYCIKEGNFEGVRILLDNHADPGFKDAKGTPPLIYAIENQKMVIIRLLLEHGAGWRENNEGSHYTALQAAMKIFAQAPTSQQDEWKSLFTLFDPEKSEYPFRHKEITMALILRNGNDYGITSVLLDELADPNLADEKGNTPLLRAVRQNDIKTVTLLIELGADPEYRNNKNQSALTIAKMFNASDVVKLLKSKGLEEQISENNLIASVIYGDVDTIKMLIEKGISLNITDDNKHSLFYLAVLHGHKKIVDFLITKGLKEKYGWDDLWRFIYDNEPEAVKVLISLGYDYNMLDSWYNMTPLDYAVDRGFIKLGRILFYAGISNYYWSRAEIIKKLNIR